MLNSVQLMGRLTADPNRTIMHSVNGDVPKVSFTIACEEDYKKGDQRTTYFIRCTAWRRTADFISQYFHKGDLVAISGKLITWDSLKDAERRTVTEVSVTNIYFTSSGSSTRTDESQEVPIDYDDQDLPWD